MQNTFACSNCQQSETEMVPLKCGHRICSKCEKTTEGSCCVCRSESGSAPAKKHLRNADLVSALWRSFQEQSKDKCSDANPAIRTNQTQPSNSADSKYNHSAQKISCNFNANPVIQQPRSLSAGYIDTTKPNQYGENACLLTPTQYYTMGTSSGALEPKCWLPVGCVNMTTPTQIYPNTTVSTWPYMMGNCINSEALPVVQPPTGVLPVAYVTKLNEQLPTGYVVVSTQPCAFVNTGTSQPVLPLVYPATTEINQQIHREGSCTANKYTDDRTLQTSNMLPRTNSSEETKQESKPSGTKYLCRPLNYCSIQASDSIVGYKLDRCSKFVAPGFLDSTKEDHLIISEFSGNRVLLCTKSLQLIQEYNFFRTSKNVFAMKDADKFLCSDWYRISLVDIEHSKLVWNHRFTRPLNPWGLCVLEGANQVAVCLPTAEQICLFDIRSSSPKSIGEWSFKGVKWSDRLLPYAIAPNGMVTVGTSIGRGVLVRCDLTTGKPLEVLTHLDAPMMAWDNDQISLEIREECANDCSISSAITDIALDCEQMCIVPDALRSRVIFRSNNGDINVLNEDNLMHSPSGVALLSDGTLIISDNKTNNILTCTM